MTLAISCRVLNGFIHDEVLCFSTYEHLTGFLLGKRFSRGIIDTILFIKHKGKHVLLVQIYVDDIIFRYTNKSLCREFSNTMHDEFEISLTGKLICFLGLQIKQTDKGTFISETKYCLEVLKKYEMKNAKSISTRMASNFHIDKDASRKEFEITKY